MKIASLLLCATLAAAPAIAQKHNHDHVPKGDAAATAAPLADAEVRKVDKAAGKVTLKHGEIRNLDMPPMTMVFQVQDKAALETLKEGDKVKFTAERVKGGYVVTSIKPAEK